MFSIIFKEWINFNNSSMIFGLDVLVKIFNKNSEHIWLRSFWKFFSWELSSFSSSSFISSIKINFSFIFFLLVKSIEFRFSSLASFFGDNSGIPFSNRKLYKDLFSPSWVLKIMSDFISSFFDVWRFNNCKRLKNNLLL